MRKLVYLLIVLCGLHVSCTNSIKQPTPEEIYGKYHRSVVLIRNEYLYKITIDDKVWYCTNLQADSFPKLYDNFTDAYLNRNISFGTGFFITRGGMIATNRHVLQGNITKDEAIRIIRKNYRDLSLQVQQIIADLNDSLITAINDYNFYADKPGLFDLSQDFKSQASVFYDKKNAWSNILNSLQNIASAEVNVEPYYCKLSIINDNPVNENQWNDCSVIKISDDPKVDLALIQTNQKSLPSQDIIPIELDYSKDTVFSIANDSIINNPLKINTQVYMIGYNYGDVIATTSKGLKSQLTQGTVSQESDGYRVLYSIPALPGSSGSPVFDKWGHIIAINYAGLYPSQSFNYGILSKHLLEMQGN